MVDDSNSMALSDPFRLRAAALDLLMGTQGNEGRTLGAVEFGSGARALFGPGPIGPNAAAFEAALAASLDADAGGTDYNAAFAAAAAHNPAADARIFLTDGQHTGDDPYANPHRGGPPAWVIGLGVGYPDSPSDLLLRRIARDTGGFYRRVEDAAQLQAAMFDVASAIGCLVEPKRFADAFRPGGRPRSHTVRLPRGVRRAQLALTWERASDRFAVGDFRAVRDGKARRIPRLKVSVRRSATFAAVQIAGRISGVLRFTVSAQRVTRRATVTTQITRPR